MSLLSDFRKEFLEMQHAAAPDPDARWEIEPPVVRYICPGTQPHCHSVSLFTDCADPDEIRAIVERETRLARSRRRGIEWKCYDFPRSPELRATLEALGYRLSRVSRLLFAPVDLSVAGSSDTEVERIATLAGLIPVRDINFQVWQEPSDWILDVLWREISVTSPLTEVFLSRIDGKAAAAAWVRYMGKIAFFFGGSTVPEFRGRGAYKALVRERISRARERGMQFVLSECTPDSERVLRGLGFSDGGVSTVYVLPFEG